MICFKYTKEIKVEHCEICLGERLADPLCFKRGFIWGIPDGSEPRWVLTHQEALNSKEDVSHYFNEHRNEIIIKTSGQTKKHIPADIRWSVWERDDFTCQACGKRKHLLVDHIYPESKGGTLCLSNLQTLCRQCNSKKGVKVYDS